MPPPVHSQAQGAPGQRQPAAAGQYYSPPGKPPKKAGKGSGWKVTGILFLVLTLVAAGVLVWFGMKIAELENEVDNLEQNRTELEQHIDELDEIIDNKETFGALTRDLFEELKLIEGMQIVEKIPVDTYEHLIQYAYEDRRDTLFMQYHIEDMEWELQSIQEMTASFAAEQASNATGFVGETYLDRVSKGYASSSLYRSSADPSMCNGPAGACVYGNNHTVVHFNMDSYDDMKRWYGQNRANGWVQTVAYHEFAHVMQYANRDITKKYEQYFEGARYNGKALDPWEWMADCYAANYVSRAWEDGYGNACSASQLQQAKRWENEVTFTVPVITQQ